MIKKSLAIVVSVLFILPYSALAADEPTILAAVVEDTGTAEVVRLVVSPIPDNLEHKIACDQGQVRIRLNVAPRTNEIQNLEVPQGVPNRRVRIVPRDGSKSVIQLYPRHKPKDVCSNTSVMTMGNEVAITTIYSDSDIRYREKVLGLNNREDAIAKAEQQLKSSSKSLKKTAPQKDTMEKTEVPKTKKQAEETTAVKKTLFNKAEKKDPAPVVATSDSIISGPRAAAGCAFAAFIALGAWYFKKYKKGVSIKTDSIEILSSKRLGRTQQIILTQVHGTKFLLAVSDKNVTTLGTVPDDTATVPDFASPVAPPVAPQTTELESSLETLIAKAVQAPEVAVPKQTSPGIEMKSFKDDLQRAIGASAREEPMPMINRANETPSNVAGLVAMARMRANLRSGQNDSSPPQA